MTNIFSSFFQVAGAKSFSDFLKENDKKTCSRKRVRIKDGVPNQKDIEHNKKCEPIKGGLKGCVEPQFFSPAALLHTPF